MMSLLGCSNQMRITGLTRLLGVCFASILYFGGVAYAQHQAPLAAQGLMYDHIMKAKQFAGDDLVNDFYHRCFIEPLYPLIAKGINAKSPVPPLKVFDNLYFVGQNAVSSWVIKTSKGLILIDTQDNPAEAKEYIEGGMTKLGLDPKQLKYIIITHEHPDHFGGSKYLQQKYEKYGIHVYASGPAWKNMANPQKTRNAYLAAKFDRVISDGEKLTLGDTTLTFYLTPGHTDGTISFIFNTTDHGIPHKIGFFGGMGSPRTAFYRQEIVESYGRWLKLTEAAGVDTLITNHPGEDHTIGKLEFDRIRHASDPNPFVLGENAYHRYFEIQEECEKADLARHGEPISQ